MFMVIVTQTNVFYVDEKDASTEAEAKHFVKENCIWDESDGSYGYIIQAEKVDKEVNENKYSQRQWDRVVGYGPVPDEYKIEKE